MLRGGLAHLRCVLSSPGVLPRAAPRGPAPALRPHSAALQPTHPTSDPSTVHADIYDEFCAKSAARAAARVVGDPFTDGVEQGPQVDEDQMNKVRLVGGWGRGAGGVLRGS